MTDTAGFGDKTDTLFVNMIDTWLVDMTDTWFVDMTDICLGNCTRSTTLAYFVTGRG